MKKLRGFTLLEMLVVMGIIGSVSLVAMPITINQIKQTNLQQTVRDMNSAIFLYQQNAYASKNSKSYGVYFESDKYTLYIGESFATAEVTEPTILQSDVSISQINLTGGGNEIKFTAGGFRPTASGTIVLSDAFNSFALDINSEGLISNYKL